MISRRLDGALPPSSAARLEAHLVDCARCSRAADEIGRAWALVGEARLGPAAPDDFAAIERRAAATTLRGGGWPLRESWAWVPSPRVYAGALAACMVVGTTGGVLLSRAALRGGDASLLIERSALSEGFDDLPFGSPAAGLAGGLVPAERMP
jgi:hypothetical protein